MKIVELFMLHLLVYFVFLMERSKWYKNEMQSTAIHYAEPVIFYSFLYVVPFHLFSDISKTVFEPSHIQFCREFEALSFDKKNILIKGKIEEKFQKYQQRNSLCPTRQIREKKVKAKMLRNKSVWKISLLYMYIWVNCKIIVPLDSYM